MKTFIYIGVDVSKRTLDIDLLGNYVQFGNSKKGIAGLVNAIKETINKEQTVIIVMEASGGYERLLVESCAEHSIDYHVAHANKVRSYAKSKGLIAKTDQLDCGLLTDFGQAMNVQPDVNILNENSFNIKRLLKRREELQADKQRENNRLDKITALFNFH